MQLLYPRYRTPGQAKAAKHLFMPFLTPHSLAAKVNGQHKGYMNRASGSGRSILPCDLGLRFISAQFCARAHGGDLHPKRRSASTPTRFTRGRAGRAPHTAAESAAHTLDPTPQPPPVPQLPGTPCREPRASIERTHRAPTMLFYDQKSPLSAVGRGRAVPWLPRALLPSCGRREKCIAGGCGAGFLERGRSPGPFVGPVLSRILPRRAYRMIRRFLSSVRPATPPSWAQSIWSVMSSGRRS